MCTSLYYLPAPYFLSQLECSLLEHEFEEETCGRDVGVYLCERATATNGGDDNDGQKVRWTWHLPIRSSIETSGGSKIFFIYGGVFFGHCDCFFWNEVRCGVRLRHWGAQQLCTNQRTEREERGESCPGPGLVLVLVFECCESGVNKGATIPPGTGWKVGVHLSLMTGRRLDCCIGMHEPRLVLNLILEFPCSLL